MATSMTGFGSASLSNDKVTITVQVKSVNSRFLEVRIKSPSDYNALDSEIRKTVSRTLSRGNVDVLIQRSQLASGAGKSLSVDLALVRDWKRACLELKQELKLSETAFESLLIDGPHLVQIVDGESTFDDSEKDLVLKAVEQGVKACHAQRSAEGSALKNHLAALVKELQSIVKTIEGLKATIHVDILERIKTRIEPRAAQLGLEINADRMAQEVLLLTDRMDIEEELKRLDGHLIAVTEHLNQSGILGKKLEFYVQELLRETNTLGSKVQDLAVATKIIEAKTVIERMREQGQNIE